MECATQPGSVPGWEAEDPKGTLPLTPNGCGKHLKNADRKEEGTNENWSPIQGNKRHSQPCCLVNATRHAAMLCWEMQVTQQAILAAG